MATEITADGAVVPGELPGGRAVEAIHIGPYETLATTYQEIQGWTRQHDLRPAPLMWESYLTDPADPVPAWRAGEVQSVLPVFASSAKY